MYASFLQCATITNVTTNVQYSTVQYYCAVGSGRCHCIIRGKQQQGREGKASENMGKEKRDWAKEVLSTSYAVAQLTLQTELDLFCMEGARDVSFGLVWSIQVTDNVIQSNQQGGICTHHQVGPSGFGDVNESAKRTAVEQDPRTYLLKYYLQQQYSRKHRSGAAHSGNAVPRLVSRASARNAVCGIRPRITRCVRFVDLGEGTYVFNVLLEQKVILDDHFY